MKTDRRMSCVPSLCCVFFKITHKLLRKKFVERLLNSSVLKLRFCNRA
jgi:hypothetical protein